MYSMCFTHDLSSHISEIVCGDHMFFCIMHTVNSDFMKHNEDIQFIDTGSLGGCGDLAQLVESFSPMHKTEFHPQHCMTR